MNERRQYPCAREINTTERLKLVTKLHGMGFSVSRIARELDYSIALAKKDVAAIINRFQEIENFDEHLKNVTARTQEQIERLESLRAILSKQLDYFQEWVQAWVYLPDGSRVPELDEGGRIAFGPRKAAMIPALVGQIQNLDKQISELLGLYHKSIDITVKLEQTERIQTVILEVIKEADPEIAQHLIRRIAAAKATIRGTPQLTTTDRSYLNENDTVDADFADVS